MIQALNIVLANDPRTDANITTTTQNMFYPFGDHPQMESQDLGAGLLALRGYFSSVRTGVNRILVNVNVATGAFFKDKNLVDLVRDFGRMDTASQYREVIKFVKKLNFETNYMTSKDTKAKIRKVHSIYTLSPFGKNASNTKFDQTEANGKITSITVQQYFQQQWNVKLRNPQAPLVDYNNKSPRTSKDAKWIPMELCYVLPGQLSKRMLTPQQTSKMLSFAARRPFLNAESIVGNGLRVTKIDPGTKLIDFGIQVDTKLLTVNGRVLAIPSLQYRTKSCTPVNGAWNLDTKTLGPTPLYQSGVPKPGPWNCLVVSSGPHAPINGGSEALVQILFKFRRSLNSCGLRTCEFGRSVVANVNDEDLKNANYGKVQGTIYDALRKSSPSSKPQFLLILLPSTDAVLYDSIKYLCDVQQGIPTVCCQGSKFASASEQYFANVAMKM
jgi:eukaryotic translation initiation factor 2C